MLSFVPTPIGNREDITLRALRLLREVSVWFCEDIGTTRKLLSMYGISASDKKLYSLTSHTTETNLAYYAELIRTGVCGVMSEAGTPGLSDPGKQLIKYCRQQNLPFEVLPGANALIPAVVATPADTTVWSFWGFLPQKKGRKTVLTNILQSVYPVYIYESVHRMNKLMKELDEQSYMGKVFVARELSKLHEQYIVGSVEEIQKALQSGKIPLKGEFVVGFIPK